MPIHRSYVPLEGGPGNDTLIADQAATEALAYDATFGLDRYIQSWDGRIAGQQGDDLIIRDRPGNYVANPDIGVVTEHPADVVVFGGSGGKNTAQDTISYQLYGGGIEIDLDAGDGGGYAEQHGLVGFEIFGRDRLHGFRHAIGTQGDDLVTGTALANRLVGLGGEDRIAGEAGSGAARRRRHCVRSARIWRRTRPGGGALRWRPAGRGRLDRRDRCGGIGACCLTQDRIQKDRYSIGESSSGRVESVRRNRVSFGALRTGERDYATRVSPHNNGWGSLLLVYFGNRCGGNAFGLA